MDSRILMTGVVILFLILYFMHSSAMNIPPPPKKRRRLCTNPRTNTEETPKKIWPSILSCIKWETISNMLHWKSEMAKLDGLLGDLQQPTNDTSQAETTQSL